MRKGEGVGTIALVARKGHEEGLEPKFPEVLLLVEGCFFSQFESLGYRGARTLGDNKRR